MQGSASYLWAGLQVQAGRRLDPGEHTPLRGFLLLQLCIAAGLEEQVHSQIRILNWGADSVADPQHLEGCPEVLLGGNFPWAWVTFRAGGRGGRLCFPANYRSVSPPPHLHFGSDINVITWETYVVLEKFSFIGGVSKMGLRK